MGRKEELGKPGIPAQSATEFNRPGQTAHTFFGDYKHPLRKNWMISAHQVLERYFGRSFATFEEAHSFYRNHIRTLPPAYAEDLARRLVNRQRKNFYRLEYREPSFAYKTEEFNRLKGGAAPHTDLHIEHFEDIRTKPPTRAKPGLVGRPDRAFDPDNIYLVEGGPKGTSPRNTPHHLKDLTLRRPTDANRLVSAESRGVSGGTPDTPSIPIAEQIRGGPRLGGHVAGFETGIPELRKRAGRIAAKGARTASALRLSFGADLIVQAATEVLLAVLEAKLSRVNEEGIQRAYLNNIYRGMRTTTGESLMQAVESTVAQVQQGVFEDAARQVGVNTNTTCLYLAYGYDLLMERQANDLADAIVSIIRGFNFVEVFHSIEPYGQVRALNTGKPLKTVITAERRREIRKDIFRYRFAHRLLVWDPEVRSTYYRIWNMRVTLLRVLEESMGKARSEDIPWAAPYAETLKRYINQYRFLESVNIVGGDRALAGALPKIPDGRKGVFAKLATALANADLVLAAPNSWQEDRRNLLELYLGADALRSREREMGRLRTEKAWRRATQEAMYPRHPL